MPAAPWFVYQGLVHGRWFWTEHVLVEILRYGAGAPSQSSQQNQVLFYVLRFAIVAPLLLAAFVAATPTFLSEIRRRSPDATLLACWIVAALAFPLLWRHGDIAYLLPAIPPLAIAGACYSPVGRLRLRWAGVLAALVIAMKISTPNAPWGMCFGGPTVQPAAPALQDYCERARGNPLIVVDAVDGLYATVLPLENVQYAVIGAPRKTSGGSPFWEKGIALSAREFDAVGTLIMVGSPQELAEIVRRHPESDFLAPSRYREVLGGDTHDSLAAGDFLLLLSRQMQPGPAQHWSCRI
jgi:hypothetical protein